NLRAGMSPEEARRQAQIKLGGVTWTQELHREQRGLPMLGTLLQDLRFGLRMLRKNPGFSLIAVLTLALGIGANTALFTGFNLLLRPKPIKDPDTVVKLEQHGGSRRSFSYADYLLFRDHAQSFSALLPSYEDGFLLGATTAGVAPEVIDGVFVSEQYLSELGGRTQLGRFFMAEENRVVGRDAVVVLSHQFWQRRFAGNPDIIGQSLLLDGRTFIVIGVTNPAFVGLRTEMPDFLAPFMMPAAIPTLNPQAF